MQRQLHGTCRCAGFTWRNKQVNSDEELLMNQHEEKKKEGDVRLVLPSSVFSLFFLILFFLFV